jgi:ABC-2 type transport system ATP-binding protein
MELRIERLSKRYPGGVQALRDVTLSIRPGMFGLLGPNGAGKSTLMRTLATLQEPDAGKVTLADLREAAPRDSRALGDIDVLADRDATRRILGYLPQEFGVYPKVAAEELLDHLAALKGITHRKERRDIVHALLQQTNLFDVRRKPLGSFSGGMKQRFGIAQALLGKPRLVIVDEPTAGLDPEERVRFHNLLGAIGDDVIVILSTHIVGDVIDLCRDMAILHQGELLMTGDPGEAVARLAGQTWERTVPRDEVARHAAGHQVLSTRLFGGRTRLRVFADGRPDASFEPVPPDLEDVYFAAIKGFSRPSAVAGA